MRREIMRVCIGAVAAFAVLGAASAARADYQLASFEDSAPDGFGTWDSTNNVVVPFTSDTTGTVYSYGSYGATDGSVALDVNHSGFAQDLAYDFVANGNVAQFMNNDVLSFDLTSPPAGTSTAGYWQIYDVDFNAQGAGFHGQATTPVYNQYYYTGFAGQTTTISINYDAYKATIAANPGWLDMIIAVNAGGGAPADFYFDNFKLSSVPEPGSIGLMAVGALGLLSRRRSRQ